MWKWKSKEADDDVSCTRNDSLFSSIKKGHSIKETYNTLHAKWKNNQNQNQSSPHSRRQNDNDINDPDQDNSNTPSLMSRISSKTSKMKSSKTALNFSSILKKKTHKIATLWGTGTVQPTPATSLATTTIRLHLSTNSTAMAYYAKPPSMQTIEFCVYEKVTTEFGRGEIIGYNITEKTYCVSVDEDNTMTLYSQDLSTHDSVSSPRNRFTRKNSSGSTSKFLGKNISHVTALSKGVWNTFKEYSKPSKKVEKYSSDILVMTPFGIAYVTALASEKVYVTILLSTGVMGYVQVSNCNMVSLPLNLMTPFGVGTYLESHHGVHTVTISGLGTGYFNTSEVVPENNTNPFFETAGLKNNTWQLSKPNVSRIWKAFRLPQRLRSKSSLSCTHEDDGGGGMTLEMFVKDVLQHSNFTTGKNQMKYYEECIF